MGLLALDGPCNGQYIDTDLAEQEGYSLYDWPSGEQVFIHGDGAETLDEDYEPDPVERLIRDAINDAEVR